MEVFYQYTGRAGDTSVVLQQERLYVYSSPRERPIDRCGELPVGAYFACSELLYYADACWMRIRRGLFSNARHSNGYIRVHFDMDAELAPKQRQCAALGRPRQFKALYQLPAFPTFLCARERVTLSRIPVFRANPEATSSSPSAHAHHPQRQLPVASVFQATECRFNDDFTELALKVTSPFGLTGWISTSFYETLLEVEDPRRALAGPIYVQNMAPRSGKWMGELPVRATPLLQAPRLGRNLGSFEIVKAVERKLVKDHIWLRLEGFRAQATADNQDTTEPDQNNSDTEAWIIERHANTAERVVIPWGAESVHDSALDRDDYVERYYLNIYGRRSLPLRKEPRLESEIVGELAPGSVVISTKRVLNERGQIWIRLSMTSSSTANPQDVTYAYAIQSSAKTNVCMLQEIPAPGKFSPKQFFQVMLKRQVTPADNQQDEAAGDDDQVIYACAEPSSASKRLLSIKTGAVVSALGSIFNSEQQSMWLQVLREDIDSTMMTEAPRENPHEPAPEPQFVVYVPLCRIEDGRRHERALFALGRALQKTENPKSVEVHRNRGSGARVVFTGGRASKLFGSQLMQPSTITTATPKANAEATTNNMNRPAAAAAGEDPTQALRDEFAAWQNASSSQGVVATYARTLGGAVTQCLQRPFGSCFQRSEATRKYEQLFQEDATTEDEEAAYGRRG